MSKKFTKPLPYLMQRDGYPIRESARWVRSTFAPIMARRLPTVLYGGFKHGFIPQYVQKHKKDFPYFLKVDIEKFYPSLSHHHLMVAGQIAYKKLHGLRSVPKKFKKQFMPLVHHFLNTIPLNDYGLPLNSSMSKALATLIYVPFFWI